MAPLYTVRVLIGNRWHTQMGEFGESLKNQLQECEQSRGKPTLMEKYQKIVDGSMVPLGGRSKRGGVWAANESQRESCCCQRISKVELWLLVSEHSCHSTMAPQTGVRENKYCSLTFLSVSSHLLMLSIDQLPQDAREQRPQWCSPQWSVSQRTEEGGEGQLNEFGEAKGEWPAHSSSSPPSFFGDKSIFRLHLMT